MTSTPSPSNADAWATGRLPEPWDRERISIHQFLVRNTDAGTGRLFDSQITLPDEPELPDNAARWVAGGLEGAFGHHAARPDKDALAAQACAALGAVLKDPSAQAIGRFYALVADGDALSYIDPLLKRVFSDPTMRDRNLGRFALWLARKAPDRGPVKVGIALAGLMPTRKAEAVILTLGRHEEFTLYAVVALGRVSRDPERAIWELAQSVTGWGRIQAVERLRDTQDEAIKAWMLRDGYRNAIMHEYLAHICAETGNLLAALRLDDPDDPLLAGARDIIRALIAGGPAENMADYKDGPEATKRLLALMTERDLGLADFLAVGEIHRFVTDDTVKWSDAEGAWTPETRRALAALASAILQRDDWTRKAEAGLRASDNSIFFAANQAAKHLGIDTWAFHLARIKADPKRGSWWEMMQTDDRARIRQAVALAHDLLPLDQIASGPADALGLGEKYWAHRALDFVVQDLNRFPGEGWPLIRAALQSPVVRNRNMALNALSAWPKPSWPDDAAAVLARAESREPKAAVRDRMARVIAGEDIAG